MPVTLQNTYSKICDQELIRLVADELKVLPFTRWKNTNAAVYKMPIQSQLASTPSSKAESGFSTPISISNNLTIGTKDFTLSEHVTGLTVTDYARILSGLPEEEIINLIRYRFFEKIDQDFLNVIMDPDSYTSTTEASGDFVTFSDLDDAIKMAGRKGREHFVIYATHEQVAALEAEGSIQSKVLYSDGTIGQIPVIEVENDYELPLVLVDTRNLAVASEVDPSIDDVPSMLAGRKFKGTWFYDFGMLSDAYNVAFEPKESIYSNPIVEGDWTNFQATGALVDATGLTFKVDIEGVTTEVTDDVVLSEPATGRWSITEGTQTAKWYYTQDGEDIVYFTKTASVEESLKNPVIEGDWTNIQKTGENVDSTGLTFKATILGVVTDVTSSVVLTSPQSGKWADYEGTQTATWTYTTGGKTLTYNKNANVRDMTIRLGSLVKMEDFEQSTSYAVKFNPKVVVDDLIDDSLFIDHTVYTTASFDHWLGAVDNGEDKAVISYSSGSEILRVYPLLADEFDIDPNAYYVAVGADLEPSFASALPAEVIEYPSEEYTGRLWEGGETYLASDLIELASDYFVLPVTDDVED